VIRAAVTADLHPAKQPAVLSPMAGSLAYAGIVEQTKVRVWGLVDPAADGDVSQSAR
jgi:hypothetical protein